MLHPRCPAKYRRRRPFGLEQLEDRSLLAVQPISLADPSQFGISGLSDSQNPSISADGQLVAFASDADNLVTNDFNGLPDAFVFNRATGQVTLVSVGSNGKAAGLNGDTRDPVISPDGRFVAFHSNQSSVLAGITGNQIYLRELATSTTTLVTPNALGAGGANGVSSRPRFSADSHHLAFLSTATNLVTGITFDSSQNVFTRNLLTNETQLVSVGQDGVSDANATAGPFAQSADGRFVAFESLASNLVTQPNTAIEQIYLRDTALGTTELVSVDVTGLAGAAGHNEINLDAQAISADGRFVLFHSGATNLVSPFSGGGTNAYLRDVQNDTTTLISKSAVTGTAVGATQSEVLSPDGRFAAFAVAANNMVAGLPTNSQTNVYVHNIATGVLTLASINDTGTAGGNDDSGIGTFFDFPGSLSFSAGGQFLAFRSRATDLVAGVTTGNRNLYARDLDAGETILLTPNSASTDGANGDSDTAVLSAAGNVVAFQSTANNLAAGDTNGLQDIFVRDVNAETTSIASQKSPFLPQVRLSNGGEFVGNSSADGRFVVFASAVSNNRSDLAPNVFFTGAGGNLGIYVHDRQTGANIPVDVDPSGQQVGALVAGVTDSRPAITPDGRFVVFRSSSKTLDPTVSNAVYQAAGPSNIFVRDLQLGTTRLASLDPTGTDDVFAVGEYAISDDGRYVALTSNSVTPFAGISNPSSRHTIFLRDLQAGTTVHVSHNLADNGQVAGFSTRLNLSANGRFVSFSSDDPNLAANDTNAGRDVFRWDRDTNTVELVSVNTAATGPGNFPSSANDRPDMTPDGRFITYSSQATDLIASDTNNRQDVFLRDMQLGTTTLISVNAAGTGGGNSNSTAPSISDAGDAITFVSQSNNLTPDPIAPGTFNVFLRTLGGTPATRLVSINAAGTSSGDANSAGSGTQGLGADAAQISPDGRYVAFLSRATNLVSGFVDGNTAGQNDLYLRDTQQQLTKLASVNQSGTASGNADEFSAQVLFGGNGTLIFESFASDLFAGDRNLQTDVFAVSTTGYSTIGGKVFNDANNNTLLDVLEAGLINWTVFLDANTNGTLDINELFVLTDAAGNYSFNGVAPGNHTVAIVQQPGFTKSTPAGAHAVNIVTDGTTITGRNFGEFLPVPDLATSVVAFTPAGPLNVGEPFTVSWTVNNLGNSPAAGSWIDSVYLSPTPALGADAIRLASVPHVGGLGIGQSYNGQVTVGTPPRAGAFHVIVRADDRREVNEGLFGANKANNLDEAAAQLNIVVPALTLGVSAQAQLANNARDRYFQVSGAVGQSLVVALASAAASGQIELYVKQGSLPTPSDFDFSAKTPGQVSQTVTVPAAQAGTYFILVHGTAGAVLSNQFTITATQPGLSLQFLGLTSGGNGGPVTIPIHGTNLTPAATAKLVLGGTELVAVDTEFVDASLLFATFNLAGADTGDYDASVTVSGNTVTLPAAFNVHEAQGANVVVRVAAPAGIRVNNPKALIEIEFENAGDTDAAAPEFELTAEFGTIVAVGGVNVIAQPNPRTIRFAGIGHNSPDGVLRSGDSGKGTFRIIVDATELIDEGGLDAELRFSPDNGTHFDIHIPPVASADPNEIVGPAGFGPEGWVPSQQLLPYSIAFENDPDQATVAAQEVFITHQLDADADLATFELGEIQFGSTIVNVPAGQKSFATSVATTNVDHTPLRVDITADLDQVTGIVTWAFRSLDPATGLLHENPLAGFLPVNDASGRGQGFVHYSIKPKAGLATGVEVTAQAVIVFDTNAPINTNITLNTIDADEPTSELDPLPAQSPPNVTLSWSGDDVGSGISTFDVLVSDDGGAFAPFLDDTTLTNAVFPGEIGHTYEFKIVATDNAGNVEAAPQNPDATIQIVDVRNQVIFDAPTGIVVVGGTNAQDKILVAATKNGLSLQVTVNKKVISQDIALAGITLLRVLGHVENDAITVGVLPCDVSVEGNAGTDGLFVIGGKAANAFGLATTAVSVNGSDVGFVGVENVTITGQSKVDTLTLVSLPAIPVLFDGKGGSDVLAGPDDPNVWAINNSSAGTLNTGLSFKAVENLVGGDDADQFNFTPGKKVAGNINGGGGLDTMSHAGSTKAIKIDLKKNTAAGAKTISSIESFVGGTGKDTLIGPEQANVWNITASNTGTVGAIAFAGIEQLTGGSQTDAFIVADGAGMTGKVDGGKGRNRIDYSAYTTSVAIDLTKKTATNIGGGIANIQDAAGGSAADTLNGSKLDNILVGNGGADTISGQAARDLIFGGTGADTLNGGAGEDILINGTTTFDASQAVLDALLALWLRKDLDYAARTTQLAAGVPLLPALNTTSIPFDADSDNLTGGADLDWFFAQLAPAVDVLVDALAEERVN